MARFEPFPGMLLPIGSTYFEFVAHPLMPYDKNTAYQLEGGEAFIYQVRHVDTRRLYALKVFKPAYRDQHIIRIFNFLTHYANLPGISLQGRLCITKGNSPELVQMFPE